ncbi:dihydrolipoamide acetyltransferase family protein [Terricaulis silvestris]|uniref:dihydrolipoamide acetyltransferase family protein n=1 Tax=Terricaulis silvestris TaxID=2686094 RepID=UPI001E5D70AC|nr:dihydrolipoamide acetyltransferase family protein [Terricaulis silvestris]
MDAELPIVMPKLGLTMQEGVLAEWRVEPGDEVVAGQIIFVVETDKISNEIEAPAAGRITRLLAETGATIEVGAPVALWTGQAQRAADASSAAVQASPRTGIERAPLRTAAESGGRLLSTPIARRMAALHNIALASVTGTGPRGRIQARDVESAIGQRGAIVTAQVARIRPDLTREQEMRRLIAQRLSRSKAEIPHFYLSADAKFDALAALREDLGRDPAAPKLSVTALFVAAIARALAEHPDANVVWRGDIATPLAAIGVGVAVETPLGVMAPVLQDADKLAPRELAAAMAGAIERAKAGKMRPGDAAPAAISISNVGMFGVRSLTPIIDPDQTYILGVGAPQHVVRPDARGKPSAVREITLTLACDHRAVDGAPAARLLSTIVSLIESPSRLLIARAGA